MIVSFFAHRTRCFAAVPAVALALLHVPAFAASPSTQDAESRAIRLPRDPAISPDGRTIAFAWQGDVWTASIDGGDATRVTIHAADDADPLFGPKGDSIYFSSDRSGRRQLYVVAATGGATRQITFDSNRKTLHDVTPDGKHLLISQSTTRGWHYSESNRAFLLDVSGDAPKRMLFDAGVRDAALSPDGTKVLFVRGRSTWSRKGYEGPQAAQLWLADLSTEPATLTRLDEDRPHFQNVAAMDPMWAPDGASYYFTSDPDGTFDIYHKSLAEDGDATRVTNVRAIDDTDDGVAFPSLSRDGQTMVLRRRFDLCSVNMGTKELQHIELTRTGDDVAGALDRDETERANRIAFTPDGKQMAFVAGQELWVMDRVLKEPVRVTNSAYDESSPLFSADGKRLFFVSDVEGEMDIWEATHDREDGIWWLAEDFKLRQVTDDRGVEASLRRSPNGSHVAFTKDTNLFVMDGDGTDHRQVAAMWSMPQFDWSPDGAWLTYATQDDNYNSDIYVVPIDGTREPFNLSRHPDRDSGPRWSGDGKRIAWSGRRDGEEVDIYWVELTKEEDESTARDERMKEALEAMEDKKKRRGRKRGGGDEGGSSNDAGKDSGEDSGGDSEDDDQDRESDGSKDEDTAVTIDFEDILDRVERLSIRDSSESGLLWIGDGSKLAFNATVDGQNGLYTVAFPRPEDPEKLASSALGSAQWLADAKEIVGLSSGNPAAMDERGKIETFGFRVRTQRDWREVRKIAFDQGWRAMRDRFYDVAYNNRDWYAIRAKYRPLAAECVGADEFSELMNMMLGELNASHMGHRGGADPLPDGDGQNDWSPTTYQLGLRFDAASKGPGLLVESVIPESPCHRARSKVAAGETLMAIDGTPVGPDVDVERLMTLDQVRNVTLRVKSAGGEERDVSVRPSASVTGLLYSEWVEATRRRVEELSDGKLGYLHIRGMNFTSFRQMEEDLFHAGEGKDGLIIDVRFNGGGSTTDHVLTALTQPVHAITQSRGSGEGYPQDRKVYASWTKPIVMMCNEHSFSNAEILSHAVKQLGRGRLVGMRTAGGVISTGSVRLLDGSSVRMPMRGWYLSTTGEDMELNGCEPDVAFWNDPNWATPGGSDRQLAVAVETLAEDVAAEAAKGKAKLVPAAALRK